MADNLGLGFLGAANDVIQITADRRLDARQVAHIGLAPNEPTTRGAIKVKADAPRNG